MNIKVIITVFYLSLVTLFGYSQDSCLYFYQNGQIVNLGDVPGSSNVTTLSIEMWVNILTVNQFDCFYSKSLGGQDYVMFDMGNQRNVRASIGTNTGNYGITPNDAIYDSEWFHLAFVYDGTGVTNDDKVQIYVNGLRQTLTFKNVSCIPSSIPASTAPVVLGAKSDGSSIGQEYLGYMDEFRMWNTCLTQTEIQARMNEQLTGQESGLITYLPLDESDTAQTAPNLVNATYNGALVAFPDNPSPPTTPYWLSRTFAEPGTQATNVTAENIYTTQQDALWTNGSGSARAVFMSTAATGSPVPVDGTTYTPSAHFGSGDQIGSSGWYCIYNGSGTEQRKISGLTSSTSYRMMVCDYNGLAGSEDYNINVATGNPADLPTSTTPPPDTPPTVQAGNLLSTPDPTSCTIDWSIGDGITRVVFVKLTNTGSPVPVNGTTYTANTVFGSGTQIGTTGWYCVYNGTESSVSVTGLTSSSEYSVMVCEFNGTAGTENYLTSTATLNPITFTTKAEVTTTSPATNIKGTSATLSGSIVAGGGETVTGRGIVYSTKDGFNPITEGTTEVSGSGTGSFSVILSANSLTVGTNYYFVAYAESASGTSYGSQVSFTTDTKYHWTGASSTDFGTAGNWEQNASPTSVTNLYMPSGLSNYPTIGSDIATPAECNDLSIANGAVLTIPVGKALTASGTLTTEANSCLVIESGVSGSGSLIYASGTPNATVQRYIGNSEWHLVSPLAVPSTSNDFYIDASSDAWLTYHTESTDGWTFILDLVTVLNRGQGYFYLIDASVPAQTFEFTGSITAADQSPSLTKDGSGWNALGNPYSSALDWDEGTWNKTNTTGSVYVWDGTYNGGDYRPWNGSAGDLTAGVIPMGQGFFVQASTAGAFIIPAGGRVHSTQGFYKSTEADDPSFYIRLQLDGNTYGNTVFVGFPENGTSGFDYRGDASKIYSSETTPQIFVVEGNHELCINANAPLTDQGKTIPLSLAQVVDGNYTFTISNLDQLPGVTIIIEDLKTGATQDLTKIPVFSFSASAADAPERFLLHFTIDGFGIENPDLSIDNNLNIYSWDNNIYIQSKGGALNQSGTVEFFDIYGRSLHKERINAQELVIVPVYNLRNFILVRVVKKDFIKTQKIFIKN